MVDRRDCTVGKTPNDDTKCCVASPKTKMLHNNSIIQQEVKIGVDVVLQGTGGTRQQC